MHLWITEFIGAFLIVFLSLMATRYIVSKKPHSKFVKAIVAGIVVFFVVWLVLCIGGKATLNPVSTFIDGYKGKMAKKEAGYCIMAQAGGFFLGFIVFELITREK